MKQSDYAIIQERREDIPEPARESGFVNFLCLQQAGDLAHTLSDELAELIKAVQDRGKAGAMTFTVKVSPGGNRKVECKVSHKTTVPQESDPGTILYVDDRGSVYGADPEQMLLNFSAKRVEMKPAKEVPVEVESATK